MSIFVDESIHDRASFIVVAVVQGDETLQSQVEQALRECGFDPELDEFKSSMKMAGNSAAHLLRSKLQEIMSRCKVAVGVCSTTERPKLTAIVAKIIARIDPDNLPAAEVVYFDEGMKGGAQLLPHSFEAIYNCNSKKVAGIQVADCAAYLVSVIILSQLGIITKTVRAETVYPDDEGEIELAWTLWASVRHALSGGKPVSGYDADGWCEPMMRPFGLFVSDGCPPEVAEAVDTRLGGVWVGCIH